MNDERAEGGLGIGGDEGSGSGSLWVNAAFDAVRLRLLPEVFGVFDPNSAVVVEGKALLGPAAASPTSPPALRTTPEPESEPEPKPEPEPEAKTGWMGALDVEGVDRREGGVGVVGYSLIGAVRGVILVPASEVDVLELDLRDPCERVVDADEDGGWRWRDAPAWDCDCD